MRLCFDDRDPTGGSFEAPDEIHRVCVTDTAKPGFAIQVSPHDEDVDLHVHDVPVPIGSREHDSAPPQGATACPTDEVVQRRTLTK